MREIHITIDKDGQLHADADGFTGQKCEQAIRDILAGMADVKEVHHKDEFYAAQDEQVLVDEG